MQKMSWEAVCKRAGGRRHYNAVRQLQAAFRRQQVASLWRRMDGEWGSQARIARLLGVSESTISRDLAALRRQADEAHRCPFCGRRFSEFPPPVQFGK